MKKKTVLFMLMLCLTAAATFIGVKGYTEESGQQEIAYSVQKISPEGEVDSSSPFYDLAVKPGDTRTIEARIINTSSETISVKSELFAAYTNDNGEISYTSQAEEYDRSLKYKFNELAEIQASDIKTEIPANGEKIIKAMIEVPETAEDGVILGSWYFEKEGQEQEQEEGSGIQINNKYSYALAVKLTVNQEIAEPNLNLTGITKGLNNYKKAYFAQLQNDRPAILSELTVEAQVFKKGSYEVLYENTSEGLIMAPNSQFAFPVFLGQEAMKAGDYTMKLKVLTEDSKWDTQTWEWTEDFTVTADEARKHNEEAINDPEAEADNLWLLILGGAVLFILVLLLIYILMKRKMLRQEQKKRKKKSKKRKK
ncbi:DUF916 and DUF3324 domain-containing protein [Enterococcus sp. BWR-S5]|uniref:DUF916 and DUF3324 domain-containing protein n=1 Tax=Enterococcus sp. BWR-S5 TaxID=2787714 RepID=UPI001922602F|nr:DUF916 and DUF3324 domain-containing protein [Enterococcus sp. BWR-S5]MBL1226813.1 DUF916 and DUF3324 domain-containing protein [Enterococcus sp. BWR-S5]